MEVSTTTGYVLHLLFFPYIHAKLLQPHSHKLPDTVHFSPLLFVKCFQHDIVIADLNIHYLSLGCTGTMMQRDMGCRVDDIGLQVTGGDRSNTTPMLCMRRVMLGSSVCLSASWSLLHSWYFNSTFSHRHQNLETTARPGVSCVHYSIMNDREGKDS